MVHSLIDDHVAYSLHGVVQGVYIRYIYGTNCATLYVAFSSDGPTNISCGAPDVNVI